VGRRSADGHGRSHRSERAGAGQVVGHALTKRGASHAFLPRGGSLVDLGTLPGGRQSAAPAINDSGQVVGASETAAGTQAAFVYSSGVLRDLNTLIPASAGWHLAEARDINNAGTIVGVGLRNGQQRAFRLALTP
jgi:probable HAF family extracellular repeat protein